MNLKILFVTVPLASLLGVATVILPRPDASPASAALRTQEEPSVSTSTSFATVDYGYDSLPGMECLVNEFGIRRKVLITRRQVRGREQIGGPFVGQPLNYFGPYYVFEEYTNSHGELTHYLVGPTPRKDGRLVWIQASDAQPWNHRMVARYAGGAGKRTPPLVVYASEKDARKSLMAGGGDVEAIARYAVSGNGQQPWLPWPITDVKQVEVDGVSHELLKLAFLGSRPDGKSPSASAESPSGPAYTSEEVASFRSDVRKLDVVFVMDTTQSTQPHIDGMKETVMALAQGMSAFEFDPDLALGLVEYRDYVEKIMFNLPGGRSAVRQYPLSRDLRAFTENVSPLREASAPSEEYAEAVYDGVLAALRQTRWRGDKLSAKVLILIGDNSAHLPTDRKNPNRIQPEYIASLARDKGVRIFSLIVPGGGDRPERQRHKQQFRFLAESTGGYALPLSDANVSKVLASIQEVMQSETAKVHQRTLVLDAVAEGEKQEEVLASHEMNEEEFTAVMEILDAAGIDRSRFQGGTAFATGWVAAAPEGIPVVEKEVFIARAELEMLISELHRLCQNLNADFASNIAQAGLTGRTDPRSWFSQTDQGPLDIWLQAKGIPTSNGLLKLTRHDLQSMAEEQRARLREDILRHYIPGLMNLRNDSRRFSLIGNLEMGFIEESRLP